MIVSKALIRSTFAGERQKNPAKTDDELFHLVARLVGVEADTVRAVIAGGEPTRKWSPAGVEPWHTSH